MSKVQEVRDALAELEAARQAFNWVTESEQVEEAIFRLMAAEKRLSRALRSVRECVDNTTMEEIRYGVAN